MYMPLLATALLSAPLAAPSPQPAQVTAGVDAWAKGDYERAVQHWRAPASAGDADAQFNLGQAYKLGRGVPADTPLAAQWYQKAASQGHDRAGDNLGLVLFRANRRAEALPWLEKSAARGGARAQFVLGTMLYNGDNVTRDPVRAYALMTRAKAANMPQAASSLAQMERFLTKEQREEGVALARRYERATPTRAVASTPVPRSGTPARPAAAPSAAPARTERPSTAAASGGWRVQLGAFRDDANARTLWGKLSNGGALAGAQPFYVKSGDVTRLLAGPFGSSVEATRACNAVKRAGADCLPVAP